MEEHIQNIKKQIDSYVKGVLNEQEIQQLWVELAKYPDLLEDLEIEVGLKKLIEEKQSIQKNLTASPSLPSWTWHAVAAAVLLLVACIQLFQVHTKNELDQFIVQSISPDQMETSDGIRAKDMALFTADSLLNLGFNALISGDTKTAFSLYNQVIENFDSEPYGSKAFTNKGILLYNSGEYESSIIAFNDALERVSNNQMIEEKAYWYKGNALVNLEQFEEARIAVHQAYSIDGIFRKPAFLLLQKLNYDLGYVDYEDFENQQEN